MKNDIETVELISNVIDRYRSSFVTKVHNSENEDHDVIMDLFGITPLLKRENRQYWGRELNMCWQLIVSALCKAKCPDYSPAQRIGADEPYDLAVGNHAIDTKYRIGSGDSGTLKKFKQYGPLLRSKDLNPVLLIVRQDNLSAAITACRAGGWTVYQSQATFAFIEKLTNFDLYSLLLSMKGKFLFERE
jgi:hypothetical protein